MKLLLFLGTFVVISQYVACMINYDIDIQCNQTVYATSYEQIRVQLSGYTPNKHCQLSFYQTGSTDKFMVYISSLSIPGTPGICSNNWLEVHDGSSRQSSNLLYNDRLCGSIYQSGVYRTSGRHLTFYFQSDFSTSYSSVDVFVTPNHSGFCNAGDYECNHGLCIADSLSCSGYNTCGEYSGCHNTINVGGIAGGVVGGIVFIICVTFIIIVCRRRRRMIVRRPMVFNTTMATGGLPPPGYNNPNYGSAHPAGAVYP